MIELQTRLSPKKTDKGHTAFSGESLFQQVLDQMRYLLYSLIFSLCFRSAPS